jgi:hypothetical protein
MVRTRGRPTETTESENRIMGCVREEFEKLVEQINTEDRNPCKRARSDIIKALRAFRKFKSGYSQRYDAACLLGVLARREDRRRKALAAREQDSVPLDSESYNGLTQRCLDTVTKAADLGRIMNNAISVKAVADVLAQIPATWPKSKLWCRKWAFKGLVRYAAQMLAKIVALDAICPCTE